MVFTNCYWLIPILKSALNSTRCATTVTCGGAYTLRHVSGNAPLTSQVEPDLHDLSLADSCSHVGTQPFFR